MIIERAFGKTVGDVPIVGHGTWQMEQRDPKACLRALQEGIDRGLRHIDTAELYGDGRVEEIVGKAIAKRREEVFLVSKVVPSNASRRGTISACHRSLRRLKTDYLDCYLLHWPGSHPLGDTIGAFEELVEQGKIRSWGVSNFDEVQLEAVVDLAGRGRVACNQVLYHLEERTIEHRLLDKCRELQVALVGYSPFGSGRFPDLNSPSGTVLQEVAETMGVTPYQVALAFLVRKAPLFTIPMTTKVTHVRQNAKAGALVLSNRDVNRIADAFPVGPRKSGVATL